MAIWRSAFVASSSWKCDSFPRLGTMRASAVRACANLIINNEVVGSQDVVGQQTKSEKYKQGGTTFRFPKKGEELELVCESLAFKGLGVCKVVDTGFVVLCERALPGERLIARIVKKKTGFAEATKLRTLSIHDEAVTAPCRYFGDCGGCKTQNLAYQAQLKSKEGQVHDLISRIGRFGASHPAGDSGDYLKPIVPCASLYQYRNKMEFSFGTQKWTPETEFTPPTVEVQKEIGGQFALGLHVPKRFDKILPIHECLLQNDVANQILQKVQDYCEENSSKLPPFNVHTHKGFLKHLMLRSGRDCDSGELQIMVNIVTSTFNPELLNPLVEALTCAFPNLVSFVNNVTSSVGNTSVGEEEHLLFGRSTITEVLMGMNFEISANSFFQTNTIQAERLYQIVEEACRLRGDGTEIVLDLFCGTGTIGLSLAGRVKHVYGYELVPEAVVDARQNAKRNGITNATFIQGDLNKLSPGCGEEFPLPDVVVIDPNRPGMHPKLIDYLLELKPQRIVYVSCNPATCARDLDLLCHRSESSCGVYHLISVQPVDMFPHTPHIECVCVLMLLPNC